MVDIKTGAIADRDTKEIAWKEGVPCAGTKCPDYISKPQLCKEVMNLQFIMPDVPGLGVWQIDTSSINSIRNINSVASLIREIYKRIAFIPLVLTLEPTEVINPDDGKKKTVRVLNLRVRGTMRELMALAAKPYMELMMPAAAEDEAPLDVETVEGEVVSPESLPPGRKPSNDLFVTTENNDKATTLVKTPPPSEPAVKSNAKVEEPPRQQRDANSLKTIDEALTAANKDFQLSSKEMFKLLNVEGKSDITMTPPNVYIWLRDKKGA
jgi:hypothetical protein